MSSDFHSYISSNVLKSSRNCTTSSSLGTKVKVTSPNFSSDNGKLGFCRYIIFSWIFIVLNCLPLRQPGPVGLSCPGKAIQVKDPPLSMLLMWTQQTPKPEAQGPVSRPTSRSVSPSLFEAHFSADKHRPVWRISNKMHCIRVVSILLYFGFRF